MVARLALIGAALIVMGLAHFGNNGTLTTIGGGVLLAIAAVVGVVRYQRGVPLVGRYRR